MSKKKHHHTKTDTAQAAQYTDKTPTKNFWFSAAYLILICCGVARIFLAEICFRTNTVDKGVWLGKFQQGISLVSTSDISRVFFPLAILIGVLCWAVGLIKRGGKISGLWAGGLILIFAAVGVVSCFLASDQRGAEIVWLEQVSVILGGFAMMQLCSDRRRLITLTIILAACGGAMGIKGLYQLEIEIPATIENYNQDKTTILQNMNIQPGSPSAAAFEGRIYKTAPGGYFALTNIFGSLLVLLVPCGLACCVSLWQRMRAELVSLKKAGSNELPVSLLALILCGVLTASAATILVFTRSRGAIGSAAAMAILFAAGWRFRKALARRFKLTVCVCLGLIVLAIAGAAIYGQSKGKLPIKTLTVRWFYCKGSAQIIASNPLWGVGGGNFGLEYPKVRPAQAEEEVKTPHNFLFHAPVQFGLIAGGVYIVLVVSCVIVAFRRLAYRQREIDGPPAAQVSLKILMISIATAVLLARAFFSDASGTALLFVLEGFGPMFVLIICLWIFFWQLGDDALKENFVRIALATGLAGFVLHNLVTYSLWMPGTAVIFWLAAGAACSGTRTYNIGSKFSVSLAAGLLAFIILATIWIARPVYGNYISTCEMVEALRTRNISAAYDAAQAAALRDTKSEYAAVNAGKVACFGGLADGKDSQALLWFKEATRRNPSSGYAYKDYSLAMLQAIKGSGDRNELDKLAAGAFELNPKDARERLFWAEAFIAFGEHEKAREQIKLAKQFNAKLAKMFPNSAEVITQSEFNDILEKIQNAPAKTNTNSNK